MSPRLHRHVLLTGVFGLVMVLAGCRGVQTAGEKTARKEAQAVTADYRPRGQKPVLPELAATSSLSNYLAYALLNQPKVEAAYYDWLASIERITQARSFPDPQLTFQMDIQNAVTSIMPGLMGAIPWPQKLRVGAQAAEAESQSRRYAYESAVLTSAFEVKRAYYQLYFLEEKIGISRETLRLLADLEKLARAQNEAGKVTLQDVLRAQIERDRLKTGISNLEDSRSALAAQFKAALGLGAGDPAPPIPARFESTPQELSAGQLLETALARNTQLKAMEADVRAAEASLILAEKSGRPDFSLGLMADEKMDPTLYRPLGTVSLPIWRDKLAAQMAEAQSRKSAAAARLSSEQIALAAGFAERSFLYRQASRNLALLNEKLIPKANMSLELARAAYLAGQIDFFNLADAQRTLLGFKLDRAETAAQREIVLAELSLIVQGMPLGSGSAGSGEAMPGAGSPAPRKMSGGM